MSLTLKILMYLILSRDAHLGGLIIEMKLVPSCAQAEGKRVSQAVTGQLVRWQMMILRWKAMEALGRNGGRQGGRMVGVQDSA